MRRRRTARFLVTAGLLGAFALPGAAPAGAYADPPAEAASVPLPWTERPTTATVLSGLISTLEGSESRPVAIAWSCSCSIAAWTRGAGPPPYPLAEASQDHLIGLAIEESAALDRPVTTTTGPWSG